MNSVLSEDNLTLPTWSGGTGSAVFLFCYQGQYSLSWISGDQIKFAARSIRYSPEICELSGVINHKTSDFISTIMRQLNTIEIMCQIEVMTVTQKPKWLIRHQITI